LNIGSPPLARRGPPISRWRPVVTGSPPLARKGHYGGQGHPVPDRITAAGAERTTPLSRPCRPLMADLRSRGEDSRVVRTPLKAFGSPPPARRGPRVELAFHGRLRLTSARAERTAGPGRM
jgi:hypothetical protein